MTNILFTPVKDSLLAVVSPLSRKDGEAMAKYMNNRNLLAKFTFDGVGTLEFFVPEVWGWINGGREDHARRYVARVFDEVAQ